MCICRSHQILKTHIYVIWSHSYVTNYSINIIFAIMQNTQFKQGYILSMC